MTPETRYQSGLAAEHSVQAHYEAAGHRVLAQRFRSRRGEIDLIVQRGDEVIFVEVKKSRTHASAAEKLSTRQMTRIFGAAEIFLADFPFGLDTQSRFDVALVDEQGQIDILENAFSA